MHAARTTAIRPNPPEMSGSRTIVCLSPDLKPAWLPQLATAKLRTLGFTVTGAVPHFPVRTRRTSKLVDRHNGLTCGGPIGLLDLVAMRQHAQAAAAAQWWLWHQVVAAGTRPAYPFWHFVDRHRADPHRYPLALARADYTAQPRVLAMTAHNARPDTRIPLPTAALESLQAGYYTHLSMAVLGAVPADGVATYGAGGGWLTCTSERLIDQLAYLQAANAHIDGLGQNLQLIAMAINR